MSRMPKQKTITIKDVAKRSNVSISTVSRVLNKKNRLVNPETRKRVLDVIDELGYYPNAMARSLHSNKTRTIGMIVQDIANPYYPSIVKSVENTAQKWGYSIILANAERSRLRTSKYLKIMCEKRVDGLILIGGGIVQDAEEQDFLERTGVKIMVIGKPHNTKLASVQIKNIEAAREACTYLIGLGHRRIAMITGTDDSATAVDRTQGYREALEANGLPFNKEWVISGDFDFKGGYSAAEKLSQIGGKNGITAIFAQNDMMAIGAMKALQKKGYRIPQDVSILGFDDIQAASFVTPTLATVAVPLEELGSTAMENLVKLLNGDKLDRPTYLQTEIKHRESLSRCSLS